MSCLFPLFGPNVFANDLRLDMPRLEVLKSYPISGERLIAAEIAAPLLVISILEMLFATSASIMMGMGEANKFTKFWPRRNSSWPCCCSRFPSAPCSS